MDGGSEFKTCFEKAYQEQGIRLFILPPRSPKLNGCVERVHRSQLWHSTTDFPYIVHPVLVCQEVIVALSVEKVESPDLAVQCALLHDVIEDGSVSYKEIEEVFGTPVAEAVQALSKDTRLPEQDQIPDSVARLLALNSHEAQMVKLADRLVNLILPYPPHWHAAKMQLYLCDAQLIHEKLQPASPFLAARLLTSISAFGNSIK